MERASRKVLVSPELMAEWTKCRTADGDLLTWAWGEPDLDGFYHPVITRNADADDGSPDKGEETEDANG